MEMISATNPRIVLGSEKLLPLPPPPLLLALLLLLLLSALDMESGRRQGGREGEEGEEGEVGEDRVHEDGIYTRTRSAMWALSSFLLRKRL